MRSARRAGNLGFRTVLFEEDRLGGTCVLKGCIPKKLMIYGSRLLEQMKTAKEYGWDIPSSIKLNWGLQKQRREQELTRLSGIYKNLLDQSGVDVVHQRAHFTKEGFVSAGGKIYKAPHILIAVGACPHRPDLPGMEHTLTSDDIFKLEKQPRSLIVVGAGYIALEFAGVFQSLGAEVTLLCRRDKVLTGFDEDVRSFFGKQAQVKGLCIQTGFQPSRIIQTGRGFAVQNSDGKQVEAEQVLFATGRKPNVKSLQLDSAGIEITQDGKIKVSKKFETTKKGIYAIGDCADTSFQLTPVALAEAEVLVKNLFSKEPAEMDYRFVPSAVFSNPPVSCVGLTEEQAEKEGLQVKIFESGFRPLKNTINPENKDEKIYMKMIVDQKTDRVLGCHIVGEDSPEIIQTVAVAIKAGATKKDFDQTIGVHPSSAEELCTMRTPRK